MSSAYSKPDVRRGRSGDLAQSSMDTDDWIEELGVLFEVSEHCSWRRMKGVNHV